MNVKPSLPRVLAGRGAVHCGRPPRELAGEVDQRILDAAEKVFFQRGFSGASVDEIAEVARAGKPTIYARFAAKEGLFAAVMDRLMRRSSGYDGIVCAGATNEERLEAFASGLLTRVLVPETIGLIRLAAAESLRFPGLTTRVTRMARERQTEAVGRLLAEFAESDPRWALPAFAPNRLPETARRFLELVMSPLLLRALLGDDLVGLRAEIGPHVARAVPFFLAASGLPGAAR